MFGLGFVHATDRLWQLEFFRKLAMGRLSEIFGSETLQLDKYVRTIGIPRMVENYIATVGDEDKLILQNYLAITRKYEGMPSPLYPNLPTKKTLVTPFE